MRLRERLAAVTGDEEGIDASQWTDRVEELLYEGERVEETVDVDPARIVVTSHRVITITPELAGANFRDVERPNVVGVSRGAEASGDLLVRGVKWTVIGLLLMGAGTLIDFGGIVGSVSFDGSAGGQIGIGGVLGFVQGLLDLIRQLDEIMLVLGALATLFGIVVLGVYLWTRDPTVAIEVAGDEDLHVPRPDDERVTERLRTAVAPPGPPDATETGGEPLSEP